MTSILRQFVAALIFILSGFSLAFAQVDEEGRWKTELYYQPVWLEARKYTLDEFATAQRRLETIKNGNSSDEWAGDYVSNDTFYNATFRWSPESGFVYISIFNCGMSLRGLEYGTVSVKPDFIVANSERSGKLFGNFIRVKWGERRYLIYEHRLSVFYSHIAGYGETGGYDGIPGYLHEDDVSKPIYGVPVLPQRYASFAKQPIDAVVESVISRKVVSSGDIHESNTLIRLDIGSLRGVRKGMEFRTPDSNFYETFTAVRVYKNSSIALVTHRLDENLQETDTDYETKQRKLLPIISPGLRLTTRPDGY